MRQLHIVNRGTRRFEHREGLLHAAGHLWIEAGSKMLRHATDPHAGQRLFQKLRVGRHGIGQRRRIARVMAGNRLEHERAIGG